MPQRPDIDAEAELRRIPERPAGEGQGANRPQAGRGAAGENEEEAAAVEEGFSPVP